jgi:hypothetical protein
MTTTQTIQVTDTAYLWFDDLVSPEPGWVLRYPTPAAPGGWADEAIGTMTEAEAIAEARAFLA